MNQEENINTKIESREKQDHYQKYRGHSLEVLETLEHSGGMTTRQISDAILGNARVIAVTIQRLVHRCVIEKVENWGWKINVNGLKILSIFNKKDITTNNKNVNTTTTQQQHKVNMKKETTTKEQTENVPSCFKKAYCHIRRFLDNPVFNSKTAKTCNECVHDDPNNYPKNLSSWQVVKISNGI
jgi:hypothetical protein